MMYVPYCCLLVSWKSWNWFECVGGVLICFCYHVVADVSWKIYASSKKFWCLLLLSWHYPKIKKGRRISEIVACLVTRKVIYFSSSLRFFNYDKYLKSNTQVAPTMGAETCLGPLVRHSIYSISKTNLTALKNFNETY